MDRNQLSLHQVLKLGKWLEANLTRVEPAWDRDIAEAASRELDFTVTASNVSSVLGGLGIEARRPSLRRTGDNAGDGRTNLQFLAAAVLRLHEKLGEEAPRYLRLLTHRQPVADVAKAYDEEDGRKNTLV